MKSVENEFLLEGVGAYFKKTLIAEYGKVKTKFLKATGVKQNVYFADIKWDEVLKLLQYQKTKLSPISKFHPVKRDLSLAKLLVVYASENFLAASDLTSF